MSAKRSYGRCTDQTEDKPAVFERVWHRENSRSQTAFYQMQQGATVTELC